MDKAAAPELPYSAEVIRAGIEAALAQGRLHRTIRVGHSIYEWEFLTPAQQKDVLAVIAEFPPA